MNLFSIARRSSTVLMVVLYLLVMLVMMPRGPRDRLASRVMHVTSSFRASLTFFNNSAGSTVNRLSVERQFLVPSTDVTLATDRHCPSFEEALGKVANGSVVDCTRYNREMALEYETYVDYYGANHVAVTRGTCLVTQLTLDRVSALKRMVLTWRGKTQCS